jgi:hypothetical protein
MASPIKDRKSAPLPAPNSSFYDLIETLTPEELTVVKQVRTLMETKIAPIITKHRDDPAKGAAPLRKAILSVSFASQAPPSLRIILTASKATSHSTKPCSSSLAPRRTEPVRTF